MGSASITARPVIPIVLDPRTKVTTTPKRGRDMVASTMTANRRGSTAVRIGAYVVVAYALSWICWLPLAFSHQIVRVGGWPTHLPGLLGPAAAAVVVTAAVTGRAGIRDLLARLTRWRIGWWWLVALSPLALLGLGLAAAAAAGQSLPRWGDFGRINGFPTWGPLSVLALLIIVNGLGEEAGWRGFLQPTLQRALPPRLAILAVAVIWAGWHAPLFAILTTYRGFTPLTLVGFGIGLTCGALVLGWLYNRTGSILAVAVWHATYNVTAATDAAHGLIAAVSTTAVIIAAASLLIADVATHGRVLAAAADGRSSGGKDHASTRRPEQIGLASTGRCHRHLPRRRSGYGRIWAVRR